MTHLKTTPQYAYFQSLMADKDDFFTVLDVGRGLGSTSLDIFVGEQQKYHRGDSYFNPELEASDALYPIDSWPVFLINYGSTVFTVKSS